MTQQVDQLLFPRWLVPIEPQQVILEDHALAIKDGLITAILPREEAKSAFYAKEEWHGPHHVLIPGLINTHTHSPMNLFKGIADDLPFHDWLHQAIWPRENQFINPEFIEDGSLLAAAEMLLSGTTTFNDMYIYPEYTIKAVKKSKMRAVLGLPIFDFATQWSKNTESTLKMGEALIQEFQHDPHIFFAIAPHAPYTVSDSNFLKAKDFAEKHQLLMHCHLHETQQEILDSLKNYGLTPIQRLEQLGLLNDRFLAVHMIHVNTKEQDIIAKHQVSIAHCPESNMKLASGIAPISSYLNKGINVTIGTDGAASNNDLDLLGEIQTASLIAKGISQKADSLNAWESLAMATTHAAKALKLENLIGSLKPGLMADITAFDLKHIATQPVYNPVAQLIYAASRDQVSDVWVGGKQLVKNKKLTTLDVDALIEKAEKWAAVLQ